MRSDARFPITLLDNGALQYQAVPLPLTAVARRVARARSPLASLPFVFCGKALRGTPSRAPLRPDARQPLRLSGGLPDELRRNLNKGRIRRPGDSQFLSFWGTLTLPQPDFYLMLTGPLATVTTLSSRVRFAPFSDYDADRFVQRSLDFLFAVLDGCMLRSFGFFRDRQLRLASATGPDWLNHAGLWSWFTEEVYARNAN